MTVDQHIREAEKKMTKAVEVAKEEFAAVRTGRAHPAMFSKIQVDYYGSPTPLQQLASFQVPEARQVVITPYDRNALHNVERAIRDSDLGVNPTNDGTVIRITLPDLTEERRKEYVKLVKSKAEDARVSVRNIRRSAKEAIESMGREGEVGEDEVRGAEKRLDGVTKKYVEQIDDLLAHKESEILEV